VIDCKIRSIAKSYFQSIEFLTKRGYMSQDIAQFLDKNLRIETFSSVHSLGKMDCTRGLLSPLLYINNELSGCALMLTRAVIHELVHYLQMREFKGNFDKEYNRASNWLEVEAENIAMSYSGKE